MIIERNDGSTIEGEIRIPLFIIDYGTIQMLKWIMAKVDLNWLLKKIKWTNVETNHHKE